jgi:hypothetical protein
MIGEDQFDGLLATRCSRPDEVEQRFCSRARRPLVAESGTVFLVAADHPARGSLAVGDRALAMANRRELLERLVVALDRPGVDGVLGTPDVLEDLLLLGALENKVVIGSMNRGGLRGSVFESDDRFTSYTAAGIRDRGLDGGKMLLRIADDDPGTLPTLVSCAHAVDELAANRSMAMVEVFAARNWQQRLRIDLDPIATARAVAIASGLGGTSAYTWLKLPIVDRMEDVVATSSLPVLLLGGDGSVEGPGSESRWLEALRLPQVRGLVVGRTLLYPPDGDVSGAVDRMVKHLAQAKQPQRSGPNEADGLAHA